MLTNEEVLDISILPLYEEDKIYDTQTKKIAEGGVLDMRLVFLMILFRSLKYILGDRR